MTTEEIAVFIVVAAILFGVLLVIEHRLKEARALQETLDKAPADVEGRKVLIVVNDKPVEGVAPAGDRDESDWTHRVRAICNKIKNEN